MTSFTSNKLKWYEFWDTFEVAVHLNEKLSGVEKFTYLRRKLVVEARNAISGLSLSNDNYNVAVGILKERFLEEQDLVHLHYRKLLNLPAVNNTTSNIKMFLDNVERHLRSLEVLKQDVNQDMFVSMVRSRLPEDVMFQLEIAKGSKTKVDYAFVARKTA